MTRKSKREIERTLENLGGDDAAECNSLLVVYEEAETGDWYRSPELDGDPIDESDVDQEPLMVILKAEYVETDRETDTNGVVR